MTESRYWEECYQRASYYLWCGLRGHILTGNDPLSGAPRTRDAWMPHFRNESRTAYKALARFWLEQLRNRRERGHA